MAEIKKIDDIKYDFKDLTPFKWYVLENFPFIEADFDALTNWQLLCKLGKELNKVIDSQNSVGAQVEILTTAFNNLNHAFGEFTDDMLDKFATFKNETNTTITNFKNETNENMNNFTTRITNQITDFENTSNTNYGQFTSQITKSFQELQDYVENYFKNLNIQDEVNTKLDEMVQDGSFQKLVEEAIKQSDIENIIKSYLTNVVYGYDTLSNLKAVNSIEAGNIARTLGNQTMTDGKGSYYKIRTKTTSDVVDEDKIVSLTNFPNLVAEKIEETGTAVETNENPFDVPTICIGDEYITGINGDGQILPNAKGWADYYKEYAGLSDENFTKSGGTNYGFFGKPNSSGESVETQRFEHCLTQYSGDKTKIKKIIVMGGLNDLECVLRGNYTDLIFRISTFLASCSSLYPNAKVYVGMCTNLNTNNKIYTMFTPQKTNLVEQVFQSYKYQSTNLFHAFYINGIETALKNYNSYMNTNSDFPTNLGYQQLAVSLIQYFNSGSCYLSTTYERIRKVPTCSVSSLKASNDFSVNIKNTSNNGFTIFKCDNITLKSDTAVSLPASFTITFSDAQFTNYRNGIDAPETYIPIFITKSDNSIISYSSVVALTSDQNGNTLFNFTLNYQNKSISDVIGIEIATNRFTIPTVNC